MVTTDRIKHSFSSYCLLRYNLQVNALANWYRRDRNIFCRREWPRRLILISALRPAHAKYAMAYNKIQSPQASFIIVVLPAAIHSCRTIYLLGGSVKIGINHRSSHSRWRQGCNLNWRCNNVGYSQYIANAFLLSFYLNQKYE